MKRILVAVQLIGLAALTQACVQYQETLKNNPTSAGSVAQLFLGDWHSVAPPSFVTPQTCGDLTWTVTSQDATHMGGNFEATCAGGVRLTGTATGYVDGNLHFQAVGTATGLGPISCPFMINGTGTPQANSTLRVDYTGTTCVGDIGGTEVLQR